MDDDQAATTDATTLDAEPLFSEPGANWWWVVLGPISGAVMLSLEISSGMGPQPLVPLIFLVMVSGFIALQVKAARIHTSVELTRHTLRQGTETIAVDDILKVYPEPDTGRRSYKDPMPDQKTAKRAAKQAEAWQTARAIGELSGVPKGRKGIGLRLTGKRTVQAWARRHRELRAALTPLIEERHGAFAPDSTDDENGGEDLRWPL